MKHCKYDIIDIADGSACFILVLAIGSLLYTFLCKTPIVVFKFTDCLTVILASITILATVSEYKSHRERIKAEVLGQYNERYSKDEHVNKVVNFLISTISGEKVSKPSVHDVEMFMRFFEEMELQIEKGRMESEDVYKLFSYYALYLDSSPKLISSLCIDDYSESNWELFLHFVNRMAKIGLKRTTWISKDDKRVLCSFDDEGNMVINGTKYIYLYEKGYVKSGEYTMKFYLTGERHDAKKLLIDVIDFNKSIYIKKEDYEKNKDNLKIYAE